MFCFDTVVHLVIHRVVRCNVERGALLSERLMRSFLYQKQKQKKRHSKNSTIVWYGNEHGISVLYDFLSNLSLLLLTYGHASIWCSTQFRSMLNRRGEGVNVLF